MHNYEIYSKLSLKPQKKSFSNDKKAYEKECVN